MTANLSGFVALITGATYLASDDASFVHCALVAVDGGRIAD